MIQMRLSTNRHRLINKVARNNRHLMLDVEIVYGFRTSFAQVHSVEQNHGLHFNAAVAFMQHNSVTVPLGYSRHRK